jgi:hypothetical protein
MRDGGVRLVAVDIDGTLLDKHHMIGESARLAKKICDTRGVAFTVATGRVSTSAEVVACELGITTPLIANGGATIKMPGGPYLRVLALPGEAARRAIMAARRYPVERYVFTGECYVTETLCEETLPYSQALGIPIKEVRDLVQATTGGAISLVLRANRFEPGHEQLADRLKAEIEALSAGEFRVEKTLPHLLEVLHRGASKGEALRALCDMLTVPLASSMAIGDGFGDIDMIDAAGIGVLVANAHPSLSGGSRKRTRASHADGVLEAVRAFVLGESGATL